MCCPVSRRSARAFLRRARGHPRRRGRSWTPAARSSVSSLATASLLTAPAAGEVVAALRPWWRPEVGASTRRPGRRPQLLAAVPSPGSSPPTSASPPRRGGAANAVHHHPQVNVTVRTAQGQRPGALDRHGALASCGSRTFAKPARRSTTAGGPPSGRDRARAAECSKRPPRQGDVLVLLGADPLSEFPDQPSPRAPSPVLAR